MVFYKSIHTELSCIDRIVRGILQLSHLAALACQASRTVCIKCTHGGAGVVHTPVTVAIAVGCTSNTIGNHTAAKLRLAYWYPARVVDRIRWPPVADLAR